MLVKVNVAVLPTVQMKEVVANFLTVTVKEG